MAPDLPSGTVTFLFTDVEGSTKLLHELGAESYAEALAEHRRLIRQACSARGGVEVDTQGDAFFFAFPTAPGGLQAACEATERLSSGKVHVRIGLHTGTPLLTTEGYVGEDVHRAARIASAGHGGQVLVSSATAALVDIELRDLGDHRFKDLSAPERVFQLGEVDFSPLKTLHQTNLPIPQTPFLGREKELGEVLELLSREDVRLLTLTGPGGTGKTRLAAQAAGALAERYPHGVFWVPLAPLSDPALVIESAGQVLGARDGPASHIADKKLLLLFDNFEQVIEAASELASLLASCPSLDLLVTSREPLHLTGEQEYLVPTLVREESVGFFLARARAVKPDFAADKRVPEICLRLDDLPLALELAAARVKALSPEQILSRLEQRLPLLTGGARDLPERQRTLRSTIEWSHELLSPEEQELFRRLSVFAGGCTLDAAEEVCEANLDTLQSLVEKSLLRFSDERYWMLETIREFAGERLADSEEEAALRGRHARWYGDLAERAEPEWNGVNAASWFIRFESELSNLRHAIEWGLGNERLLALEIVSNMPGFWLATGRALEAKRLLDDSWDDEAPPELRIRALRVRTGVAIGLNDSETLIAASEERLELSGATGDRDQQSAAMNMLASGWQMAGDPNAARQWYEAARALARETGNRSGLSATLGNFGRLEREEGNLETARRLFEEQLAIDRAIGDEVEIAWATKELAMTATEQGAFDEARELLDEGFGISSRLALRGTEADLVFGLAGLESRTGRVREGAVLFGAWESCCEREGFEVKETTTWHWKLRAELVAALGETEFESLAAEGRSMDADAAVRYARSCLDSPLDQRR
ncbi:MAG: tetratricopeptide repeat protein [Actinomycetota bacterium]|nr:tetratricopeptide repeat protein [Actinomycetota bacterium]